MLPRVPPIRSVLPNRHFDLNWHLPIKEEAMKRLLIYVMTCVLLSQGGMAQPSERSGKGSPWLNATDQKIWGLMTIWAQTKYAFPHRERLSEINWDSTVQAFIPRVLEAKGQEGYYRTLMELVAVLRDSHTEVIPPWGRFTPGFDMPPVEVKVIDDKFFIIRTGDTEEMRAQNVVPGMEIVEIGDGIPVRQFFQDNVLKYHSRGSKWANEAVGVFYLLYGPKGTKVHLTVRDGSHDLRKIELTRDAMTGGRKPFLYTFVKHLMAKTIDHSMLADGILYVNLPNFESENAKIRDDFVALIDTTDLTAIKGIIIDLRYNLGGSHNILHPIVGCLIDSAVKTPTDHYVEYAPAPARWGEREAFILKSRNWEVPPRDGKRYNGPLVLLIGPTTHSSGEDMVIELSQTGRCTTIGEPTAGGAGGRFASSLPGGGEFTVSTFRATYPDGKEYMEMGIQPDVEIRVTLDDILAGKDRVLEKGIDVIRDWESIPARQRGM